MTTEIERKQTARMIATAHTIASGKIREAYTILEEAQKDLAAIGDHFDVLPDCRYAKNPTDEILLNIKKRTWQYIFQRTNVRDYMTTRKLKAFQESLEEPKKLPEITEENIREFVENIILAAPDLLNDFVRETFQWLLPTHRQTDKLKTLKKNQFEIQQKTIVSHICKVNSWDGKLRMNYNNSSENLNNLDSAFRLLDGKGIAKYPDDLKTVTEIAFKAGLRIVETDYFKIKFYGNGNAHIEFRRADLLQKLNQVGGGLNLKTTANF